MWSVVGSVLATFVLGVVGGVIGWLGTSFFAKPFVAFLTLRSQVHEELVFTGNVGQMTAHREAEHARAADALRRLGAKMQAMDATLHAGSCKGVVAAVLWVVQAPLRKFLSGVGFDLATAGRSLIGLSNALTDPKRSDYVDRVEAALKLPPTSR
jgi:hypothetical protein